MTSERYRPPQEMQDQIEHAGERQEERKTMSVRDQKLIKDLIEAKAPVYVRSNTDKGYERVTIIEAIGDNVVVKNADGKQEFRSKANLLAQHREGEVDVIKRIDFDVAVKKPGGGFDKGKVESFDEKNVQVSFAGDTFPIAIAEFLKTQAVASAEALIKNQEIKIQARSTDTGEFVPGVLIRVDAENGEVVVGYDRVDDNGEEVGHLQKIPAETLFAWQEAATTSAKAA
ncbi:MAG: hypothetical protein ABIH67_02395 [Candidatus Uhrbacteria bacterium]